MNEFKNKLKKLKKSNLSDSQKESKIIELSPLDKRHNDLSFLLDEKYLTQMPKDYFSFRLLRQHLLKDYQKTHPSEKTLAKKTKSGQKKKS